VHAERHRALPRPCTDSASSISVVAESSIEKACTGGQRQVSLTRGAGQRREAGAARELSKRKRRQWNW
jgi:hypothetical protein